MVVGLYVGIATVGIFAYWYMYDSDAGDGHTLVTFSQLANFSECKTFTDFFAQSSFGGVTFEVEDIGGVPSYCNYFLGEGKSKACTLSLSVLVTIEMMNAFNALSENGSLLQVPPSRNWWLILAVFGSMAQHCLILYIPFLSAIFGITPLTWHDWKLVLAFSFPVIIIDELLKIVSRIKVAKEMQLRLEEKEKEE
jgi:P-type Ca2+ transporter type 2C